MFLIPLITTRNTPRIFDITHDTKIIFFILHLGIYNLYLIGFITLPSLSPVNMLITKAISNALTVSQKVIINVKISGLSCTPERDNVSLITLHIIINTSPRLNEKRISVWFVFLGCVIIANIPKPCSINPIPHSTRIGIVNLRNIVLKNILTRNAKFRDEIIMKLFQNL